MTTSFVQEADPTNLWRLDVIGILDPIEKSDKLAETERTQEFLIETANLNSEGRYEVRLPWKKDHAPISRNYEAAKSRLKKCVEKLSSRNLLEQYDEVFKQWLAEGIIEEVFDDENKTAGHYLPHRSIIKAYGTTKIRPVFGASASSKGNPSLNQCLETGPNLIELIPSALNRFREKEIRTVNDRLVVYRHCRVVFGLTCSPFLLTAIIELHLSNLSKDKDTATKLKKSFYVDNCVTSVDSVDEIETFVKNATSIMAKGGFELRGWENSGKRATSFVLSVLWHKERDVILINPALLKTNQSEILTKRQILSATHRIFDPIGFTCPVSLFPKILLRKLWTDNTDWDSEIKDNHKEEFTKWVKDLDVLKLIKIPQKLGKGTLTLHTFCDASSLAYAAAEFARVEDRNTIKVTLINAVSRIAPVKATIPRLELMAATIGVRLTRNVVKSLSREINNITFWTDSTTVLAWIKRDLQWGVFVWN
ncbi:uncharacterized protein [Cardiocondyla obscurior]|uniref:uncharacterized protein n=1 Tax=Cardiocondyla obscurior TaxID=286306 RepID=UPI0039655F2A